MNTIKTIGNIAIIISIIAFMLGNYITAATGLGIAIIVLIYKLRYD